MFLLLGVVDVVDDDDDDGGGDDDDAVVVLDIVVGLFVLLDRPKA